MRIEPNKRYARLCHLYTQWTLRVLCHNCDGYPPRKTKLQRKRDKAMRKRLLSASGRAQRDAHGHRGVMWRATPNTTAAGFGQALASLIRALDAATQQNGATK